MWAFIIAGIVLVGSVLLAFFIAFGQGMSTAPSYDNSTEKHDDWRGDHCRADSGEPLVPASGLVRP
jgi:hypothetical protein